LLPPPETDVNKNESSFSKSFVISLIATDSEEPITNYIENKSIPTEKFFVQSNISANMEMAL